MQPPLASQKITSACLLIGSHSTLLKGDTLLWFEVKEQRGRITGGGNIEYQVTLEIGFLLEEPGRL